MWITALIELFDMTGRGYLTEFHTDCKSVHTDDVIRLTISVENQILGYLLHRSRRIYRMYISSFEEIYKSLDPFDLLDPLPCE